MPPRAYIEAQLARSAHSDDAQAPAAMGPSHASASPNAYGGNPIRTEATEIRFRSGAIAPDGPDATAGAISPDGPDAAAATAPSPSDAPGTLQPKELVGFNDHGLGLSLVARIVAAHGGTTSFSGAVGGGFRVTMEFPLV